MDEQAAAGSAAALPPPPVPPPPLVVVLLDFLLPPQPAATSARITAIAATAPSVSRLLTLPPRSRVCVPSGLPPHRGRKYPPRLGHIASPNRLNDRKIVQPLPSGGRSGAFGGSLACAKVGGLARLPGPRAEVDAEGGNRTHTGLSAHRILSEGLFAPGGTEPSISVRFAPVQYVSLRAIRADEWQKLAEVLPSQELDAGGSFGDPRLSVVLFDPVELGERARLEEPLRHQAKGESQWRADHKDEPAEKLHQSQVTFTSPALSWSAEGPLESASNSNTSGVFGGMPFPLLSSRSPMIEE